MKQIIYTQSASLDKTWFSFIFWRTKRRSKEHTILNSFFDRDMFLIIPQIYSSENSGSFNQKDVILHLTCFPE